MKPFCVARFPDALKKTPKIFDFSQWRRFNSADKRKWVCPSRS
jgi:hypothetical protein